MKRYNAELKFRAVAKGGGADPLADQGEACVLAAGPYTDSEALLARYVEATPHVPGSGMVRPSKELGTVDPNSLSGAV